MILDRSDDFYFEMMIVGYQFPELVDAEDDSNWLNVKIVVRHPQGAWSAVDPALLTYEASELANWLRAIGSGDRETLEMYFLDRHSTRQTGMCRAIGAVLGGSLTNPLLIHVRDGPNASVHQAGA